MDVREFLRRNQMHVSEELIRYAELAGRVHQLLEHSKKPERFYSGFEDFELQRCKLFEEMIIIRENFSSFFPKHYAVLFDELDALSVTINNPFPDHNYWAREAVV